MKTKDIIKYFLDNASEDVNFVVISLEEYNRLRKCEEMAKQQFEEKRKAIINS